MRPLWPLPANLLGPLPAALLTLLLWAGLMPAGAYETDVSARDPSTVVKSGGTYWVYGTGAGIPQFSSSDRVHWKFQGPVFPVAPAWVASTVPANKNNNAWAPDIHFFGGQWHLYFTYSTLGRKTSAIGVATNPTLDPRGWKDQGVVVATGDATDDNALDPCIFEDAAHGLWLSFGSYFSGIQLLPIDPQTGKQAAGSALTPIANRPDTRGNAIEASAVTFHDGYYYLFVNWDGCCAGPRSSYNIRMGRSKVVTGPYVDQAGRPMRQGGGTLFLGSLYDNGSGRTCDDEVGPGHFGILHDTDGDWVSYHEEWARDRNGRTTVNLSPLAWDSGGGGWPRVVLDPGPYQIVSSLTTHEAVTIVGDGLQTQPAEAGAGQRWTLTSESDGCYQIAPSQIAQAGRRLVLSVAGAAAPGARVTLAAPDGSDRQRWRLRQNDDGTYTVLPKSGDPSVALDVGGCNPADSAPVGLWTANGADCQKWSFRRR